MKEFCNKEAIIRHYLIKWMTGLSKELKHRMILSTRSTRPSKNVYNRPEDPMSSNYMSDKLLIICTPSSR
jgi:hypothetical protein